MKKHRWRKSIKTIFGDHIDPEKDEELKRIKIETENKIQRILKILKDEDEKVKSASSTKESIVSLVEKFRRDYELLYARYDHLTGTLKNKIRSEERKETSSSTSSDSDDSRKDKGGKMEHVNSDGQKFNSNIIQELGTETVEVLRRNIEKDMEDVDALGRIEQAEVLIKNLRAKVEQLNNEKFNLLTENGDLMQKLEIASEVETELTRKLEAVSREKNSLISVKNALVKEFEEEKKANKELRELSCQLEHEKEACEEKLGVLRGELSVAKEQLESAEQELVCKGNTAEEENRRLSLKNFELLDEMKVVNSKIQEMACECSDLREKLANKEEDHHQELVRRDHGMSEFLAEKEHEGRRTLEDKEDLYLQIKDLLFEVGALHNQKSEVEEVLQLKISELESTLSERSNECFALREKNESAEKEAQVQIMSLKEQANNMQVELNFLKDEKGLLEMQIKKGRGEISESLTQFENQKVEMDRRIVDQERILIEKEDAFKKLCEEHQQLQVCYQECKQKLQAAEQHKADMVEKFHKGIESKNVKVDELAESIEDLQRDLEVKGDEICTLVEYVRTIEVKLRLSNQKLRVTEQLLSENEESHRIKEEKLQHENRLLQEHVSELSEVVAAYKVTQYNIVTDISEKVHKTLAEMDALTMKLEEDQGHFETCVYDILNEVDVAKEWVKETKREKEQLNEDVIILHDEVQHLRENENVLRNKMKDLETKHGEVELKLQKNEDEKEHLVKTIKKLEENIEGLQEKINERDEGMCSLGEEKKEAIRQLCIWIDYHHSRYNLLKDMLSKRTNGRT